MKKLVFAGVLALTAALATYSAHGQFGGQNGVAGCGAQSGGAFSGPEAAGGCNPETPNITATAPPSTGKILLVDNTSHLLQTDATSKVCIAGGC